MQDDIQAMCAFLGETLRTNGSDVTSSTTISATTCTNCMLNVKDCWDDRFSPSRNNIKLMQVKHLPVHGLIH